MGSAPPVAEERGPAGAAAQLLVAHALQALDPDVVDVGAAQDLLGGVPEHVFAPGLERHVDAALAGPGDALAAIGRHAPRHPHEPRPRREGAREPRGIEAEGARQNAGGGARILHLARGRRDRVGEQVARQRPAPPVEQRAAHRLEQHAQLLVALGALRVVGVTEDLEPCGARPQARETQEETGRSHQHPIPAHFPVGQILSSLERRFTQSAGPSQARCGGAAGQDRTPEDSMGI